jgi:small-conductance mechanosensitive channel
MIREYLTVERMALPLALFAGGIILGFFFEKIILKNIRKVVSRTKWEGDEILVDAFHGIGLFWFTLAGLYGAIRNLPIDRSGLVLAHKALLVCVILSVTLALGRIAVGFINLYNRKAGGAFVSTSIFANLTFLLVLVLGILVTLESLGISITPLLTALGVGGLAVALALKDTLSNLFAGIHIIASKQIRPGDYVKLDTGEEGYVMDITWRYAVVRSLSDNMIIIPNSKLSSAIVTNFALPVNEMSVLLQVGVSYDCDLDKVERVTVDVARGVMKEVDGGVPEFEPFIRYNNFGDSSINFTVIMRTRDYVSQYLLVHEFIKRLHECYNQEGIEIPFPIRTLYIKDRKEFTVSGE